MRINPKNTQNYYLAVAREPAPALKGNPWSRQPYGDRSRMRISATTYYYLENKKAEGRSRPNGKKQQPLLTLQPALDPTKPRFLAVHLPAL